MEVKKKETKKCITCSLASVKPGQCFRLATAVFENAAIFMKLKSNHHGSANCDAVLLGDGFVTYYSNTEEVVVVKVKAEVSEV